MTSKVETALAVPTPTLLLVESITKVLLSKFNPFGILTALLLIVKASPLASPSVAPPLAEKVPDADKVVNAPVAGVVAPIVTAFNALPHEVLLPLVVKNLPELPV